MLREIKIFTTYKGLKITYASCSLNAFFSSAWEEISHHSYAICCKPFSTVLSRLFTYFDSAFLMSWNSLLSPCAMMDLEETFTFTGDLTQRPTQNSCTLHFFLYKPSSRSLQKHSLHISLMLRLKSHPTFPVNERANPEHSSQCTRAMCAHIPTAHSTHMHTQEINKQNVCP